MNKYKVVKSKCAGCRACINACEYQAISLDEDNKAIIDLDKCQGCGKCQEMCPIDAIEKI